MIEVWGNFVYSGGTMKIDTEHTYFPPQAAQAARLSIAYGTAGDFLFLRIERIVGIWRIGYGPTYS